MRQKLAEFLNVFFGLRKTIVMFTLIVIGILFRLYGLLSGAEFVDLLKSTTLGFFSANMIEHLTTTVKTYFDSKTQTQTQDTVPDTEPPVGGN